MSWMIGSFNVPKLESTIQAIYVVVLFLIPLLVAVATTVIASWFKVRKAYEEACAAHALAVANNTALRGVTSQLDGKLTQLLNAHEQSQKTAQTAMGIINEQASMVHQQSESSNPIRPDPRSDPRV